MKYDLYEELCTNLRVKKTGAFAKDLCGIYAQLRNELDLKPGLINKDDDSLSKKVNTKDGEKVILFSIEGKNETDSLDIELRDKSGITLYIKSRYNDTYEIYPRFSIESKNGGIYFCVPTEKGSMLRYYDAEAVNYIKEQYGENFDDWIAEYDDYDSNVFSEFGIIPDMQLENNNPENQIHLFAELVKMKPENREKYIQETMESRLNGRNR